MTFNFSLENFIHFIISFGITALFLVAIILPPYPLWIPFKIIDVIRNFIKSCTDVWNTPTTMEQLYQVVENEYRDVNFDIEIDLNINTDNFNTTMNDLRLAARRAGITVQDTGLEILEHVASLALLRKNLPQMVYKIGEHESDRELQRKMRNGMYAILAADNRHYLTRDFQVYQKWFQDYTNHEKVDTYVILANSEIERKGIGNTPTERRAYTLMAQLQTFMGTCVVPIDESINIELAWENRNELSYFSTAIHLPFGFDLEKMIIIKYRNFDEAVLGHQLLYSIFMAFERYGNTTKNSLTNFKFNDEIKEFFRCIKERDGYLFKVYSFEQTRQMIADTIYRYSEWDHDWVGVIAFDFQNARVEQ